MSEIFISQKRIITIIIEKLTNKRYLENISKNNGPENGKKKTNKRNKRQNNTPPHRTITATQQERPKNKRRQCTGQYKSIVFSGE